MQVGWAPWDPFHSTGGLLTYNTVPVLQDFLVAVVGITEVPEVTAGK